MTLAGSSSRCPAIFRACGLGLALALTVPAMAATAGVTAEQPATAKSKVAHVDLSQLTEGERVAIALATTALAAQLDFQRRADLRYANRQQVEAFMAEHKESAERTTEELEKVRQRMARLEAKVKAKGEGK